MKTDLLCHASVDPFIGLWRLTVQSRRHSERWISAVVKESTSSARRKAWLGARQNLPKLPSRGSEVTEILRLSADEAHGRHAPTSWYTAKGTPLVWRYVRSRFRSSALQYWQPTTSAV